MSFASFSKINSDNEKLSKAFLYLSFILAIFSFPICLVSFFYSKEIVILLLGKNWLPTADVLKIFSIGIFLRMSYKIPGTILRAKSLFSLTAKLQIVYAANVIFLSIIFIRLSINGVAAATTIALLIQYALSTYFVNLSLKKNPYYFYTILIKPFLISTLYVFSVGTILFILDKESIFSHNYNFLVVTGFFTLIYSYIIYRYGILFFGKPYEWWIKLIKK
jgi:O-antigen/teichoic acid export membrane protein